MTFGQNGEMNQTVDWYNLWYRARASPPGHQST